MRARFRLWPACIAAALLLSLVLPQASGAQDDSATFSQWLSGVREEALDRGIRPEVLDQAFAGLDEPLALPLERDRTQAELTQTIETYISRRVNQTTIRRGRAMMQQYRTLLGRISDTYGVPAPVLVAIWGLESNYGRLNGVQPVIPVLATLAWDPRRSTLFRRELFGAAVRDDLLPRRCL